jgi:hypothetical protein
MFLIVVVSTNSRTAVAFLDQFALQNKIDLQAAIIGSLDKANPNKNAISVIDASSVTADDVHTLKQVDITLLMCTEHCVFDFDLMITIHVGECNISNGW